MRYFDYLSREETKEVFYIPPGDFDKYSEKGLLEHALGALLYYPATRGGLIKFIQSNVNIKAIVFCLEDAIGDNQVAMAQKKLLSQLKELRQLCDSEVITNLPLLFIRVRSPEHLQEIGCEFAEILDLITGFIFPKFDTKVADLYFSNFKNIRQGCSTPLYACPILEGSEIIEREQRIVSLQKLKKVFDNNREDILNIRIGLTDLLGLYRMRRNVNHTIYDVLIMKDFIGDIVNFFCRNEASYVVSGGVWEFFPEKEFRKSNNALELLKHPSQKKLLEEVRLDMVNGLWGKTAIHPSQLVPIQSNHVISYEDYQDALAIISDQGFLHGVLSSQFANKMNEYKPHQYWAEKVLKRARLFGVFNEDQSYESLFQ
ncbi:citrate lyase subunit beta [Puteibacter caeruleilacunae]|nr:citrate lyase subunit beta [Puteibacter caeruleilacunae]